jgi:hypothetical protein
MFECQLSKKGLKMAVNALVIQTIFLLATAATAAYCWIKVLFPPQDWTSEPCGIRNQRSSSTADTVDVMVGHIEGAHDRDE